MYQAELRIEQERPCVLSTLETGPHDRLDIDIEELHDGNVTFILNAGDRLESYKQTLEESEEVVRAKVLDEDRLLVTKRSCSAYNAVYKHNGILQRPTRIDRNERTYSILLFNRDDLKGMIEAFREVGRVSLTSLTTYEGVVSPLTDRQREVLEVALDSGYFEWPRTTDSETLAQELGISRATFLEHLRKAEHKLLTDALTDQHRYKLQ